MCTHEHFRIMLDMFMCKTKSELFSEKKFHSHIGKKCYLLCFHIQIPADTDCSESFRMHLSWKFGQLSTAMLKGHRYCPEILVIISANSCQQSINTEQWQVQNKTIHIFNGEKRKKILHQEVEKMYGAVTL